MQAQQLFSETRDVHFILYELPESSLHVTCGCIKSSIVLYSNVFITEVGLKSSSGRHLGVIETIWLPKLLFKRTFVNHVTGRERLIRSRSSARFCFELSGNSN